LDETKEEELTQRTTRGGELLQDRRYDEAEAEFRAAIKLDPENPYLHIALSSDLNFRRKRTRQ